MANHTWVTGVQPMPFKGNIVLGLTKECSEVPP